jgi:hypothetical protein
MLIVFLFEHLERFAAYFLRRLPTLPAAFSAALAARAFLLPPTYSFCALVWPSYMGDSPDIGLSRRDYLFCEWRNARAFTCVERKKERFSVRLFGSPWLRS